MIWVALRFPRLPLEALEIYRSEARPMVIEQNHRVLMATETAKEKGVQEGMKLSTASSITEIYPCARDPEREEQALLRLASWAYNHTPYIQRYGEDSLLLEVSRCLRLYGGLENLLNRLAEGLDAMPYEWQTGVAHSAQAAWLLSFEHWPVSDQDSQAAFINRLRRVPVDRPVEHRQAFESLSRMGMQCLGDVLELPSAALGKRFGEEFQRYLNELRGQTGTTPEIFQQREPFCRQVPFNWPVKTTRLLELPAQQLLQQLSDYLVRNQRQCQEIVWTLEGINSEQRLSFSIGSAPVCQQWQALFELTLIRLESVKLDFEVLSLELRCDFTAPLQAPSLQLFSGGREDAAALQSLVARLQTRFGREQVYRLQPRNEHLPEAAQVRDSDPSQAQLALELPRGHRPCWLLPQAQPLQRIGNRLYWREARSSQSVRIVEGPERIEGYWWSQPQARDYFIARREDALHLWIYRELDSHQNWYAQGVFA